MTWPGKVNMCATMHESNLRIPHKNEHVMDGPESMPRIQDNYVLK